MMKILQKALIQATATVVFALFSTAALAGTLQIQLGGVNLSYDGSSSAIYDAASLNTSSALNPAQADPLTNVTFLDENDNILGSVTSDISLDLFIPDVSNIPDAADTDYEVTTPGNPGFFDVLFGTSPLASQFLHLDLNEVNVRYFDLAGVFQFTFGAAVADIGGQDLPFGLVIGDPVTVSFSAQVTSKTTSGGFITSFLASGTGEIRGTLVPEPTTAVFVILGLLAAPPLMARRRG